MSRLGRPGATGARQALAFLTPVGGGADPTPAALPWFPVVGAALGTVLGVAWWTGNLWWPPSVAAAVVVAGDLALTGLLHWDGLIDSADGLLPHLPRQRRLEVMAEPGAGAFGVAVAVVVVLLRWAALASTRPSPLLLAALWSASRTVMAVAATVLPYARPEGGLATAFRGGGWTGTAAAGGALAIVLAVAWRPLAGLVALAAAVAAATAVLGLARRRLGGFTGDVLGAAGVVGETIGLAVAAARW